jgi:hypothetical protein
MTADPRYGTARGDGHAHRGLEDLAVAKDHEGWIARSRVMLTPIAAPSIMGLFGFAMATVMLGAYQAGWYGTAVTPLVIWPLALFAGGVMRGVAAIVLRHVVRRAHPGDVLGRARCARAEHAGLPHPWGCSPRPAR